MLMDRMGFTADYKPYHSMVQQHPRYFGRGRRFVLLFKRTHAAGAMSFAELRDSGDMVTRAWTADKDRWGV